jgi:hypothetical protein
LPGLPFLLKSELHDLRILAFYMPEKTVSLVWCQGRVTAPAVFGSNWLMTSEYLHGWTLENTL